MKRGGEGKGEERRKEEGGNGKRNRKTWEVRRGEDTEREGNKRRRKGKGKRERTGKGKDDEQTGRQQMKREGGKNVVGEQRGKKGRGWKERLEVCNNQPVVFYSKFQTEWYTVAIVEWNTTKVPLFWWNLNFGRFSVKILSIGAQINETFHLTKLAIDKWPSSTLKVISTTTSR